MHIAKQSHVSANRVCLNVLQEENHHSEVRLPNGVQWQPESCWDNIYDAINDCRVLCYVVGMYRPLIMVQKHSSLLLLVLNCTAV